MTATPAPPSDSDLAWRLEAIGYDLFIGLVRLMGVDAASAFGGWLLQEGRPAQRRPQGRPPQSQALAFPDKDDAWRAAMLAAQWESSAGRFAEFPLMDKLRPSTGRVELVNGERLKAIARRRVRRWSSSPATSRTGR